MMTMRKGERRGEGILPDRFWLHDSAHSIVELDDGSLFYEDSIYDEAAAVEGYAQDSERYTCALVECQRLDSPALAEVLKMARLAVEAMRAVEEANAKLARERPQAVRDAMIAVGQGPDLAVLDGARQQARDVADWLSLRLSEFDRVSLSPTPSKA